MQRYALDALLLCIWRRVRNRGARALRQCPPTNTPTSISTCGSSRPGTLCTLHLRALSALPQQRFVFGWDGKSKPSIGHRV